MLHELLLALSGHPPPLLQFPADKSTTGTLHEHLSPAEQVLVQRLAHDLGARHTAIRDHATAISSKHPSTVCRAIATAITLTHLSKFQQAILDVERDILEESPKYVGAYKIVPLSAIVGAFDGWSLKLQWLLRLVQYIQADNATARKASKQGSCSAAQVIQWLRNEANTGYPDIEQLSQQLMVIAETAWLRLLSTWVLYGKLPTLGKDDFFVQPKFSSAGQGEMDAEYDIKDPLIPCFVTKPTANSVLFIGKSLNHIRARSSRTDQGWSNARAPELALLQIHLEYLSSLKPPISTASFSSAVSSIRLSLSQNALQTLLPISKVLEVLRIMRDFFLLERGEFAIALIAAADQRLVSRQSRFADKLGTKDGNSLRSAMIKEGEVSAVLAQTWAAIVSLQGIDDEDTDEDLELARDLIRLSLGHLDPAVAEGTQGTTATFDDLLLPSPITLSMRVPSPLDLFLTPQDVDTYSRIHSYLLSMRRAHLRLTKIFLLSVLRRDHPSPKAPAHLGPQEQLKTLSRMRQRSNHRTKILRPVWATISFAAFLLAELGEYLQGEVVKSSWDDFHRWLDPTLTSSRPGTSSSTNSGPLSQRSIQAPSPTLHDPESLTRAHRTYLSTLTRSLLLTDPKFTTELRGFMSAIDHLAALMQRLETIYQNLDLETDVGVVDTFTNFANEETDVMSEVDVARARVKEGSGKLIEALGEVDTRRESTEGLAAGIMEEGEDVFVPERGARVDRLLVKLSWAERGKENE